jgi:tripartite-type tricarboxylate transporter receptor subunit TctC
MRVVAGFLCALLAVICGSPAQAQSYPTKPVRLIVPYAPGGFADVAARIVAEKLQQRLGQQVIVENRSGGNGFIGTTAGAKAPADGYTLLVAHTGEFAVSPAVFKDIPFELERDFESITMISIAPLLVAANAKSPIQSIPDLIATAKAKPNTVGMGTPGTASINHLAGEWFADAAGIKLLHVPYKGGGPSMAAALSGEVMITAQSPGVANPHVKSGKFRLLGSWGGKRIPTLPDVPTLREQGYDAEFYIWAALFAPKGLPADIAERLRSVSRQVARDADFGKAMGGMNTPIDYRDGAEFRAFLDADSKRLAEVIRKMGKTQ